MIGGLVVPISEVQPIMKEDGVSDIEPIQVRLNFGKALWCERNGHNVEAYVFLNKAIEIESMHIQTST